MKNPVYEQIQAKRHRKDSFTERLYRVGPLGKLQVGQDSAFVGPSLTLNRRRPRRPRPETFRGNPMYNPARVGVQTEV